MTAVDLAGAAMTVRLWGIDYPVEFVSLSPETRRTQVRLLASGSAIDSTGQPVAWDEGALIDVWPGKVTL